MIYYVYYLYLIALTMTDTIFRFAFCFLSQPFRTEKFSTPNFVKMQKLIICFSSMLKNKLRESD